MSKLFIPESYWDLVQENVVHRIKIFKMQLMTDQRQLFVKYPMNLTYKQDLIILFALKIFLECLPLITFVMAQWI